jgi:hypothetical protein
MMNAQFVIESGIPIPVSPPTRKQGANRRAIEATLRSMKRGDSFTIPSPHLTGEVHCVAANLGLWIKIEAHGKVWRCWLLAEAAEGTRLPKPLPPEQPTPPNPRRLGAEITAYLEKQKLQPEYAQNNKIRFRHPQKLSRVLTLHQVRQGEVVLSFAHALPEFAERWSLSSTGELPLNLEAGAVWEALDDFFEVVFGDPPPGSPPFEKRMGEVEEVIKRYANNHKRANNYELNYEDLVAIGKEKAYEVYIRFGDKPTYEFQCLVARSIERKFDSLLSKHYQSKCRGPAAVGGADVIALTDEMTEVLPSMHPEEIVMKEEWEAYLGTLTPTERLLLKSVITPPESLRLDRALDDLRYQRVKDQQPQARLLPPKGYALRKLALATAKSENELKIALAHLIETNPSTAWAELVESLNG